MEKHTENQEQADLPSRYEAPRSGTCGPATLTVPSSVNRTSPLSHRLSSPGCRIPAFHKCNDTTVSSSAPTSRHVPKPSGDRRRPAPSRSLGEPPALPVASSQLHVTRELGPLTLTNPLGTPCLPSGDGETKRNKTPRARDRHEVFKWKQQFRFAAE